MDDPFDLPPDVLARIPLFAELAKVLSWKGGPVNWDLARQVAVSVAASDSAPRAITPEDNEAVASAVRLAELWLEERASLPAPSNLISARAATPVDWAEHATVAFAELIDPIAAKASKAAHPEGLPLPEGFDPAAIMQALQGMAPMFMGAQSGTVLGTLAREVTGSHELGMPTSDDALLIVLDAVDRFAEEFGLDDRAVRQWIAVRAAGFRMAYEGFPWMRAQFFSHYHSYVASLDFDLSDAIGRLQELDLSDPGKLQEAMGDEGLLAPKASPETDAAAARVATVLRLTEAHVDAAVSAAAAGTGDTARIEEGFRRRGADTSRGARMFVSFIGLDPNEGRRRAERFVQGVLEASGFETLNRMWDEPETFPTDEELEHAPAWLARVAG